MATERGLKRLLQLRKLEEEQSRRDLEIAIGNRSRIERDLAVATEWHAESRRRFLVALCDKDATGRVCGVVEMDVAQDRRSRIEPALDDAEAEIVQQREELLSKRSGRQQLETLVESARAEAEVEALRRAQQILDDWYGRTNRKDPAFQSGTAQRGLPPP